MAESIFPEAQSFGGADSVDGTARNLGEEWSTSAANKKVTAMRVWVSSSGKPTGMRAQLWQHPSTLIKDILLDSLSAPPSLPDWLDVPPATFSAAGPTTGEINVTQNQHYIASEYIPSDAGGIYNFETSGSPVTSGTITGHNCLYRNGGTSSQAPNTNAGLENGLLGADITLEDAAADQVETLEQVTRQTTVNAMTFAKQEPVEQITRQTTVNAMTFTKGAPLTQIARQTIVQPMSFQGGAAPVAGGWIPKVGRHCAYLQQKTVNGNANYVKRRPCTVTGVVGGNTVNLRVGHSGETYANVDRKLDPDANDVNVYVSY